jgi:hypothetical protein
MKTHYEVLGVAPASDRDALRRAYLDLARRHHPDTGGDPAAMLAVNDAWAVLSDPARRARYDLSIGRAPLDDVAAATDATVEAEAAAWDDLDPAGRDAEHDARPYGGGRPRSGALDAVSLLAVLVLAAATGLTLLFGMVLTMAELLGLGVFLAFLTTISLLARLLLAMRSTAR